MSQLGWLIAYEGLIGLQPKFYTSHLLTYSSPPGTNYWH